MDTAIIIVVALTALITLGVWMLRQKKDDPAPTLLERALAVRPPPTPVAHPPASAPEPPEVQVDVTVTVRDERAQP